MSYESEPPHVDGDPMSESKPGTTGWIVGIYGYRRRGRVIATGYETEDGTKWSSLDVLFNPDPVSEPKTTVCPVCQGTSPEGVECPRCRLALGNENRVSEPNERPDGLDEWLESQDSHEYPSRRRFAAYIHRLEADNAWRRTTLANRDKTVSRMSKELASVKTERDEARINLRRLEASAAPKPVIIADGEHTPGPWTFRSGGDLEVKTKRGVEILHTPAHVVKVDQDGEGRKRTVFICDCAGVGLPNEANARLIAAAPETAAELERAKALLALIKESLEEAGGTLDHKLVAQIVSDLQQDIRQGGENAADYLTEERDRLRAELERVKARAGALYADALIGHTWFEKQFGEGFNGRDFAIKCPMANGEMDRLRETNRDQATILADLREWMSVAGMAVEKDVDMLFVLKGRFDALETNRELVELLELLDRMGGLGLDKHEWIRKALVRAKVSG